MQLFRFIFSIRRRKSDYRISYMVHLAENDRSRCPWWSGRSWGGDYENYWETRAEYARHNRQICITK